jgi:hypothetical protein
MISKVCDILSIMRCKTIWIVLNFLKKLQDTNGCHEVANQKVDVLEMLVHDNLHRVVSALNINMVLFG